MEQTPKRKTAKPYLPALREHAVRLAMEHRDEYQGEAARADGDHGYRVRATSGRLPRPDWTSPPVRDDEAEWGEQEW